MSLHLRRLGGGPRKAVALHCSLAHGGAWAGVAEALPGVELLAPDLVGHGRSPDWDGETDVADATLAAVLEVMPEGPADLIGHSFGAVIALAVALERPAQVRSLTLVEPVLFAAARMAGDPAHAAMAVAYAPYAAAMEAGRRREAAALFQAVWGAGIPFAVLPEPQADYIAERIHLIAAAQPALEADRLGLLSPGRLEGLAMPVLLIEGDRSPPVVGAIQAELARRLPNARREVVPGAGHMVPLTHPVQVAALIAGLIAPSA